MIDSPTTAANMRRTPCLQRGLPNFTSAHSTPAFTSNAAPITINDRPSEKGAINDCVIPKRINP